MPTQNEYEDEDPHDDSYNPEGIIAWGSVMIIFALLAGALYWAWQ